MMLRISKEDRRFSMAYTCLPRTNKLEGLAAFPILFAEPNADLCSSHLPNVLSILQSYQKIPHCSLKKLGSVVAVSEGLPVACLAQLDEPRLQVSYHVLRLDVDHAVCLIGPCHAPLKPRILPLLIAWMGFWTPSSLTS